MFKQKYLEYGLFVMGFYLIMGVSLIDLSCNDDCTRISADCRKQYSCRYEGSGKCYACEKYWNSTQLPGDAAPIYNINHEVECGNYHEGDYVGGSCEECDTDVGGCGAWATEAC